MDACAAFEAFAPESPPPHLKAYYGGGGDDIRERCAQIRRALAHFKRRFPNERRAALLRAPGRVNLMGVHIDHRGGWCNYLPIPRETVFCFSPREDGVVSASNADPQYGDFEFSMDEGVRRMGGADWLGFVRDADTVRGDWRNYVEGAALKLAASSGKPLKGMNLAVCGDIPPKSGLSSSSSLVVAAALALCAVNGVEMEDAELAAMCGEAEWYVGTRGGCGDHAAMVLGRIGLVAHVGFLPVNHRHYPMPENMDVVLCHSGIEASKAGGARETFNSRIAAYEIALILYRLENPDVADRVEYIRDIQPDFLDMPVPEFYRRLARVPAELTLDEILAVHPECRMEIERVTGTYGRIEDRLPLRETLLFGVFECRRSRVFADWLGAGRAGDAGRLMYVSHDGDRVASWNGGSSAPYRSPYSDEYLMDLAERAERGEDGALEPALQPGGYRCSLPEIDRMVDRCKTLPGVYGAGLTGAGLGGSILILAERGSAGAAADAMRQLTAQWTGGPPLIEICKPAHGAGFLPFPR